MRDYDVFVLGGGIAGAAAALAASAAGARVALARRGPGASALGCGGWTGAAPAPLLRALAAAGHALQPAPPLPHPDGSLRRYDLAPPGHVAAALAAGAAGVDGAADATKPVLVCGVAGLGGFRPGALARLWTAAAGLPVGLVGAAEVLLPGTPAAGWAPAALAGLLDREPDALVAALDRVVRGQAARRVILPAVLGVRDPGPLLQRLAEAGIDAGEALGGAPSIPGWRLDVAILAALRNAGVSVYTGLARAERGQGDWRVMPATAGAAPPDCRAGAVVLATGAFLGGGITGDPVLAEPATGLRVDVVAGGRAFHSAGDALLLTSVERQSPQPLLAAGADDPGLPGLFLAGAVRAGVEGAALGLGEAATDGWSAGNAAATAAGRTGGGSV